MNNRGFTLIELVMFIVIGGIFLPASLIAFTSVMNNYSRPDYYLKARFYAEKRISEITNRYYDKIVPGDCPTVTEGSDYTVECTIVAVTQALAVSGTQTYSEPYKRVVVTVKHTGLIGGEHSVATIVTRRPRKPTS